MITASPSATPPSAVAAPTSAALQQAPGTLLWIGTRTAGEMVDVYKECEATAPQIAIRVTIEEAISRPAGLVRQIVIARPDRSPADDALLTALRQQYAEAEMICLLGSGCEGERRTGHPWPGLERVYWHQWNQRSRRWLCATDRSSNDAPGVKAAPPALIVVVAANFGVASPVLDLLQASTAAAVWMRPGQQAAIRGASAVLWDDSAAPPASRQVWRRRLSDWSSACGDIPPRGGLTGGDQPHHLWLVGFPRLHAWHEARRGGVGTLISKPCSAAAMLRLLDGRPGGAG